MRKAAVVVLTCSLLFASAAEAAGLFARLRGRDGAADGMFPGSGDVEGLEKVGRVLTYKGQTFTRHFGSAGNRYVEYGLISLKAADYDYGGPEKRVVVEIAAMESADAAAGLYHHHRAAVVRERGEEIPVGVEGMIDAGRGGRSIYFYKGNLFVKVIYSGKMPIPDLLPVAREVDKRIRSGSAKRPEGFKYIDIPGIDMSTVAVTPGHTFSISDLPPAVWASAPGGGSTASDLFIITRTSSREAAKVVKNYAAYLERFGADYEEYDKNGRRFHKAVDPAQGRVVLSFHKTVVVIAARPDGYEKGEALIEAVVRKVDAGD